MLLALLLAQDLDDLIRRVDAEPAVAEQIFDFGEAARGPLRGAGKMRLLEQLDLSLTHARFENFAHRLWFGTEEEAFELLVETGGITERRGKFESGGVKGFLAPPALNPVLREFAARFRAGPVARVCARLVTLHRLDDFEPDLLAMLPTADTRLLDTIVEALGFIGTSKAQEVMLPRLLSKDAGPLTAAHKYVRRTLPDAALPMLIEGIRGGPDLVSIKSLETIVRYGGVEHAISAIDSPKKRVRRAAMAAVAAMRPPEAIPRLTKAIDDDDSDCRLMAIQALVDLRARDSVPAMLAALDKEQPIQIRILLATSILALDPERIDRLGPMARDPEAPVRRNVLISLADIDSPAATALLVEALGDADGWNRAIAAEGLTNRDTPEVRAALLAALDDKVDDVKERALLSIESIGMPEAVPKILTLLDSDSAGVRARAGRALYWSAEFDHAPLLIETHARATKHDALAAIFETLVRVGAKIDLGPALESPSEGVRLQALDLAFQQRSPLVLARLDDRAPEVRRRAARALALMGRADLVPRFVEMLGDRAPEARMGALEALDILDARERLADAEALIDDEDKRVRWRARLTAAALGGGVESRSLMDLLDSDDPDDRGRALSRIRNEKLVEFLDDVRALTRDDNRLVRRSAVAALGELGDTQATDLILARLDDEDLDVRAAALIALTRVDPTVAERHVIEGLDHASEIVRRAAVTALRELPAERAEPHLLKCLKVPALRPFAIETLAGLGRDAQLEFHLDDRSAATRSAAIAALAALGKHEAAPKIARALGDPVADVRAAACAALRDLEARDYAPQIRELLDPNEPARREAVLAAHAFRDEEAVPKLRALVRMEEAALALLDLGGIDEIKVVIDALEEAAPGWQDTIVARLATVESPDLAPALERLIRKRDNLQRYDLISLCGTAALQDMEPLLGELLDDPSFMVRVTAMKALAPLQASEATRAKLEAAEDDPLLRLHAAAALAAAGDRRAIPWAKELLGNVDDYRRTVPTGRALGAERPFTFGVPHVREAETALMIGLNRLRRRAAWATLAEARVVEDWLSVGTAFTGFAVEGPDEAIVVLTDVAPARRTERLLLHRVPGVPIVDAERIRILEFDEAREFWIDWLSKP